MNPAAFSVRQPVLVNLLMMLVIVIGIFTYMGMSRDLFPDVTIETISVTTLLPGASPKEIEQLITIPIEEELADVDLLDEMTSTSTEGSSLIILEFESGVENFFEKLTEVQNEIDKVQNLPDEADESIVTELKVSFDTITVAVTGNAPEHEIKKFVELLDDELNQVEGVTEIAITGLREREIWVEVDPGRLQAFGMSLQQVSQAIRQRNLNLPGGQLRMGRGEFTVRTEAEFKNLDEILNTIIKEDGENGYVYLHDVAEVRDTFEERRSISRLNGEPAVTMVIKKDLKSNAIEVVKDIRKQVAKLDELKPPGTEIRFIDDRSENIRTQLESLYSNLTLGLVLVMLTFTIFIGLRAAIMVSLGLPVAFLGTFILMDYFGYNINMLTLFSLILVLGLIVDDAIVVCENIYRHYEDGLPIKEAAIKGTGEILWPVIATVATTIAAFLPLLLMSGTLGRFMGVIPVVVTLALIASLFEALVILPSHVSEFGARERHSHGDLDDPKEHPVMSRLMAIYRGFIRFAIKLRYLVVPAVMAAAFMTMGLAGQMDFILFGGRDLESFSLVIEGPPGASLAETNRIMTELEEKAVAMLPGTREIDYITMKAGSLATGGGMISVAQTNMGELSMRMIPLHERERFGQVIREEYREKLGDATGFRNMNFEDRTGGPPTGKAVQVRVRGDDFERLREIAEEVKEYLGTIDGVVDIMDNFPPGKDEVRPVLDMEKVAALGLDVETIAMELRTAFEGVIATTVHDSEDELDVVVKHSESSRRSIEDMESMVFATPMGAIPFRNFGSIERAEGYSQISHYNEKRTINVLADVITDKITSQKANEMLIDHFSKQAKIAAEEEIEPQTLGEKFKAFADFMMSSGKIKPKVVQLDAGYSLSFGGEFEDTSESLQSMVKAFVVAIILIYVILGSLFQSFIQPLIVMFTVPFSFIGAIVGFYVSNEPLGMFAIIGIIALSGIVVNDGLILIEFINSRRRMGFALNESIVEAGVVRLRPVLLTSITTILGLAPLGLNLFGGDPLMKPMALAIMWGLTFATVLTLVVIPCVYRIFDDFSRTILRKPLGISRAEHKRFEEMRAAGDETTVMKAS